jgi:hypothetical protein
MGILVLTNRTGVGAFILIILAGIRGLLPDLSVLAVAGMLVLLLTLKDKVSRTEVVRWKPDVQ